MKNKTVLMILDGWGKGRQDKTDGIYLANTPYIDELYKSYPNSNLITYGKQVGLPEGQMGNSEVGHMNIGAGRIVFQDLMRINNTIEDKSFYKNPVLLDTIAHAKANNVNIHLMGLVSYGGVHSAQEHVYALCDLIEQEGASAYIHAFTDGRDCDPKSGIGYLGKLEEYIADKPVKIASVIGRYYAMDRDKRWERVKLAYDLLTEGKGTVYSCVKDVFESSYAENITDEFIKPSVIEEDGNPVAMINPNDVVICFNFRTDRCREITEVLTQEDLPQFDMKTIPLYYVTMTNYDSKYHGVKVVFDKDNLKMTMGEVMEKEGLNQIRIAETEKYPHVTFFFSGGREDPFNGEKRIMVNSPKVATYDLQPEMSAPEVTDKICAELDNEWPDFVCLNFANGDMVGHTGVPAAIIKACETVDSCVKRVVETGLKHNYSFVIIADHGNADNMLNLDGTPNTAHSMNLVPCIVIDPNVKAMKDGILADVSPTILQMMGLEQPKEMTGESLIVG